MLASLRRLASALALVGLAAAAPAHAGPYSSLTVFGDSLSDTGNLHLATGFGVPAPYFNGRITDGPNWIDVLAGYLGLPQGAVPSLGGGNNYAFAGARTGVAAPPPGVLAQVGGLWSPAHPTADATGLYVIVGGGNDMRDARAAGSTDATRETAAQTAFGNILQSAGLLAAKGAQHILIGNLPDLGATPEAVNLNLVANSTDATNRFNAALAGIEALLEAQFAGLDVIMFDLHGVAAAVRDDALNNGGAVYGITNANLPCASFTGGTTPACSVSAFSDTLHPSAAAHAIIGRAAFAAVPVPATALLVAIAFVGLAAQRRRRA